MSQPNASLEGSRIDVYFGGEKFSAENLRLLTTAYGFVIAESPSQVYSFTWSQGTTIERFKQRVLDGLDTTDAIASIVSATLWTIDAATQQPHPEVFMQLR